MINESSKLMYVEPHTTNEVRQILAKYRSAGQNSHINEIIAESKASREQAEKRSQSAFVKAESAKKKFLINSSFNEEIEKKTLIESLKKEILGWQMKYQQLNSQQVHIYEELNVKEYEKKIKDLKREVEELAIKDSEKEKEIISVRLTVVNEQQELIESEVNQRIGNIQAEIDEITTRNSEMNELLEQKEKLLQESKLQTSESNSSLKAEIERSEREIERLKLVLQEKEIELERLRQENIALDSEEKKEPEDHCNEELVFLEAQNRALRGELEITQQEIEDYNIKFEAMERETEKLSNENQQIRDLLEKKASGVWCF